MWDGRCPAAPKRRRTSLNRTSVGDGDLFPCDQSEVGLVEVLYPLLVVGVIAPVPVDRNSSRGLVEENILSLVEQFALRHRVGGLHGLVHEGIELFVDEP